MSRRFAALWLLAVVPLEALAHANLVVRRQGENIKVDTAGGGAPCGAAVKPVPDSNKFRPGARVVIQAVETIHHPSHYFLSLSNVPNPAADASLVPVKIISAIETDVQNKAVTLPIADALLKGANRTQSSIVGDGQAEHTDANGTYRQSSTVKIDVTIEIPTNVTCNPTCTLQFIQQMEENVASPTYYKSCTDIAIATDAPMTPPPPKEEPPPAKPDTKPGAPSTAEPLPAGCH